MINVFFLALLVALVLAGIRLIVCQIQLSRSRRQLTTIREMKAVIARSQAAHRQWTEAATDAERGRIIEELMKG